MEYEGPCEKYRVATDKPLATFLSSRRVAGESFGAMSGRKRKLVKGKPRMGTKTSRLPAGVLVETDPCDLMWYRENWHRDGAVISYKYNMTWQAWTSVRPSLVAEGKGLFAERDFVLGDSIGLYTGKRVAWVCWNLSGKTRGQFGRDKIHGARKEVTRRVSTWVEGIANDYIAQIPVYKEHFLVGYNWIDGKRSKTGYVQYSNCWNYHQDQHTTMQLNARLNFCGTLFATRDIPKGTEILWDYYGDKPIDQAAVVPSAFSSPVSPSMARLGSVSRG